MKSTYRIKDTSDKSFTIDYSKEAKIAHIEERKSTEGFGEVAGTVKEVLLNEVKVLFRDQDLNTEIHIEVTHDFPLFKIHFELEGSSLYTPDDKEESSILIEGGHYNFFFLPTVKGTLSYTSTTRRSIEIFFTENYLKKIFKERLEQVSTEFGIAIKRNSPYIMFDEQQPIPSNLSIIINDIINCTYDKEIKEVFITSKINEVFSYLL